MNRILFVSVWARSKGIGRMYASDEDEYDMELDTSKEMTSERFMGWEGAVGAGARAIGLKGY